MKTILMAAILACSALTFGQDSATSPSSVQQPQQNANSATKDNSGISGDQVTKPAGSKGTTLIGCLAGPDADGKYTLSNMQHRMGVNVLGSDDDLKKAAGDKVKLTGAWQNGAPPDETRPKGSSRPFQATNVEVVSESCKPPSVVTQSKKQQK